MERRKSTAREYLEAFLVAGIFLFFANTFVVKTFYIPSSSMEETLLVGDHLFANRFIYGMQGDGAPTWAPQRQIRRGDIVVFRSPEQPTMDLIKRAVALPGDRVEMRDKRLYVNGELVEEPYTVHRDPRVYPSGGGVVGNLNQRDNFGSITVPEDHFFFLGDNRDYSYDSRYYEFVPAEMVAGRAVMIYWSYSGPTSDGRWQGYGATLRRIGQTLVTFPVRTRWERTFRVIR